MDALTAFLHAHWHTVLVGLAVYIALGTLLAKWWPMPPATARWYVKAAHFLLVNLPLAGRALQGRTFWGFSFAIPLLSWTLRDDDPKPPTNGQSGRVGLVVLMVIGALGLAATLALAGCATCKTLGDATCARKALTGIDTLDGAAARLGAAWVHRCAGQATDLAKAGKPAEADQKYTSCEQTGTILVLSLQETVNAVDVAAPAVDIAEAAKSKDYSGILVPVLSAAKALYKAFLDAGIHLPTIPGVL